MKSGMLWFDDDPKRSIEEKVERAAERFREKYGVVPNLCYANPRTVESGQRAIALKLAAGNSGKGQACVAVRQARSILPNHFWLGVSEQ